MDCDDDRPALRSFRRHRATVPAASPAADLRVRNVFQDRERNAFWFGTLAGGLVRQEGSAVTVFTKADGLRSNTIRQILQDRSGVLWIALDSGLSRWDGHSFQNYYLQDGLSYPSDRCMTTDLRGDILVGTDAGLNRVHDGRIVRRQRVRRAAPTRRSGRSIRIPAGHSGWARAAAACYVSARAALLRFTRENGLLTNTIFQILEDRRGKLWMSTSSGVISADRKELDCRAGWQQALDPRDPLRNRGWNGDQSDEWRIPTGRRANRRAGDLWFPA